MDGGRVEDDDGEGRLEGRDTVADTAVEELESDDVSTGSIKREEKRRSARRREERDRGRQWKKTRTHHPKHSTSFVLQPQPISRLPVRPSSPSMLLDPKGLGNGDSPPEARFESEYRVEGNATVQPRSRRFE